MRIRAERLSLVQDRTGQDCRSGGVGDREPYNHVCSIYIALGYV